jgi:hypothetical protein
MPNMMKLRGVRSACVVIMLAITMAFTVGVQPASGEEKEQSWFDKFQTSMEGKLKETGQSLIVGIINYGASKDYKDHRELAGNIKDLLDAPGKGKELFEDIKGITEYFDLDELTGIFGEVGDTFKMLDELPFISNISKALNFAEQIGEYTDEFFEVYIKSQADGGGFENAVAHVSKKMLNSLMGIAGGEIGKLVGKPLGTALGTSLGSVIPVLGNAAGGIIGGFLGRWGGGRLGKWAFEKFSDYAFNTWLYDDVYKIVGGIRSSLDPDGGTLTASKLLDLSGNGPDANSSPEDFPTAAYPGLTDNINPFLFNDIAGDLRNRSYDDLTGTDEKFQLKAFPPEEWEKKLAQ